MFFIKSLLIIFKKFLCHYQEPKIRLHTNKKPLTLASNYKNLNDLIDIAYSNMI